MREDKTPLHLLKGNFFSWQMYSIGSSLLCIVILKKVVFFIHRFFLWNCPFKKQSPCNYPFKLQLYWLLTKTIWNGYFLINPTTDDTLVLIICVETKLHPSAVLIWFLKMRHTDLRLTWNTSQSTILSITSVKHRLSISYDRKRPVTLYFPSKSTPTSFLHFCRRITFKGKILGKNLIYR